MNKFQKLRKENPVFLYKNYHIYEDNFNIEIMFDFEFPGLAEFHPKWNFNKPDSFVGNVSDDPVFERLVFSLGMVEAVSYWKACCSPEMRIECGELSNDQIHWWKKLYYMGLSEFLYVNDISEEIDSFININSVGMFNNKQINTPIELKGCLVPIGGGKDSALTLEILFKSGIDCRCYSINNRNSINETVRTAGLNEKNLIVSNRIFDRSLIELNNKGYLNGHTPFSAVVAFSAEITAYLNGLKYIVLSNESSANESTVAGQNVNHQYSKSFDFENNFHIYEEKYLKTGIYYFSFLRPLSEFQIAKMFVSYEKYLPVFKSCNLGSKITPDIWCASCPKCLFVSLILSPFLSQDKIAKIFGKNLLDQPEMLNYFLELIGLTDHKPFECVGSIDEVNLAVSLAIHNYEEKNQKLPFLFKEYKKKGLYVPKNINEKLHKCYNSYDKQNLLTSEFETILKKEMERIL